MRLPTAPIVRRTPSSKSTTKWPTPCGPESRIKLASIHPPALQRIEMATSSRSPNGNPATPRRPIGHPTSIHREKSDEHHFGKQIYDTAISWYVIPFSRINLVQRVRSSQSTVGAGCAWADESALHSGK